MGEREGHIAFLRSLKQGSEGIAIYQDTVDAVLAEVDDLNAEVARLRRGERPSSEFSAAEITLARAEGRPGARAGAFAAEGKLVAAGLVTCNVRRIFRLTPAGEAALGAS